MTYARARLLLGISGVGLVVVFSAAMICVGIPQKLLPNSEFSSPADAWGLIAFLTGFLLLMHLR